MLDRSEVGRWGYLKEDFRLFHLKDSLAQRMDAHYHEFDKLILPLHGKVTYLVEGVTYYLKPWDVLLVRHSLIHRPIIDPSEPYERVVLWMGPLWLKRRSGDQEPLDQCFTVTRDRGFHLLRLPAERRLEYMSLIQRMEEAARSQAFGASRMADTLCQQLMILVNRDVLADNPEKLQQDSYRRDPKIEEIRQYIAAHLPEPLSVELLAQRFYLSRYYLMHRFKEITGYTVHQYISQKRLLLAGELLSAGLPVMASAEQAGFCEYSTFLRGFQNTFGVSPREFQRRALSQREEGS